ncbi:TRAP dicarboxylate transporter subunit DctQ [Enterovibrio norvegicus FF-162]|uniref:TRAP transporter small permease protein n=1 Tax=Enterovibrio norvegicus FF-454 TaxID=1185651 RepID=A0A1E5C988_9GAMM|nr:TRAP transporter small permease [Enterovibrio norvegicus]OEE62083.1 TRAP dicarboxylate transporter subunit DctQ [Enterovibrio norvegicus FF-454]OEE79100.1 TRAP dicarboxylate transporter subunit DctQ [Enterovibrio norvegicus FF-162]
MKANVFPLLRLMSLAMLYAGAAIVVIQAAWITYGVGVRYILNSPDGMVTEATALLLVPVAFLGVSYALLNHSYPKVSLIRDRLPKGIQFWVDKFNMLVMLMVGSFFLAASSKAMFKSISSGAASEILLWPRFYFWIPVVIALLSFCITALCMLIWGDPPEEENTTTLDEDIHSQDAA